MNTAAAAPPNGKDLTKGHALPSGATMHLGRPSFRAAGMLRNAVAKALGSQPLSADEMKTGLQELKADPSKGGALLQRIMNLVASEDVEAALFECLANSTYQPKGTGARVKIDRDLFDHDKFGDDARNDFYPMCYRVGEAALLPFFGPLVSVFKASLQKGAAAGPASKST